MRSLLALLFTIGSSNVAALSCMAPSLEDRYLGNSHVALVEVTGAQIEESEGFSRINPFESEDSIVITADKTRRKPQWRRIVATIRVLDSYKGESPPTRLVLTSWGERPEVIVGATYLVFLDGPDVSLDCNGMPMVSAADPEDARIVSELKALRERRPN